MIRRSLSPARLAAAVILVTLIASTPGATIQRSSQAHVPPLPTSALCKLMYGGPCLTPAQIRNYYDVGPLLQRGITGQGRTIAVVEAFGSPTIHADLHAFDQTFGLPDPSLDIVAPLGPNQQPSDVQDLRSAAEETTLDVEWAHVMAPGARILVLVSPVDETEGVQGMPQFLQVEQYALSRRLADIISLSWDTPEDDLFDAPGRAVTAAFHTFYLQAATQGITAVVGSGDNGASGLNTTRSGMLPGRVVQFPTTDPEVLSVGGTTLWSSIPGAGAGGEEVAWGYSGGGLSKIYAEPDYQRGLPHAAQSLLAGRRGVPDVAFDGDYSISGVLIYFQGVWKRYGGTSLGAPAWAGVVALADQSAGHDLGSVNSDLYRIAVSARYTRDFHDIVDGANYTFPTVGKGPDRQAYKAGAGWDAVTGLGTPMVANLVDDLGKGL